MLHRLIRFNSWSPRRQHTILFDSTAAASDVAFALGGQWDGCNGVLMHECDEVAVSTAAGLAEAQWCHEGHSVAFLTGLNAEEFLRRYAAGERNFTNANLRCAMLCSRSLRKINLSWAKLNGASLSGTDLSGADLATADLSEADLSKANLSQTCLVRTNLTRTNLSLADLKMANLSHAYLNEANLSGADLSGANLSLADLRGANLNQTDLSGANLRDAKVNEADLSRAIISGVRSL